MLRLLVLTVLLFGARVYSRPLSSQGVDCNTHWQKENKNYDFKKFQKLSEHGNIGYQDYYKSLDRENCQKDWTVLIYMAADNDLSPYSLWDIYEMESRIEGELNLGSSTNSVDVIVELDTFLRNGIRRLHLFQTNNEYDRTLTIEDFKSKSAKEISSPIIKIIDENNKLTGPQVDRFKRFLNESISKYPSKKYMVIIWGHGEGFIGNDPNPPIARDSLGPKAPGSRFLEKDLLYIDTLEQLDPVKFDDSKVFGGVAFDHSDRTYLSTPNIVDVLKSISKDKLQSRPIDILGFDACLMQSIENILEFEGIVEYYIGSEQIQNYLGMPYRKILDKLNSETTSSFELAKTLPKMAADSYSRDGYQGEIDPKAHKTFTLSSVNPTEMKFRLVPKLIDLSIKISEYFEEDFFRRIDFNFMLENSHSFKGETRDIGLLLGAILRLLYAEADKSVTTDKMIDLKEAIDETLAEVHRSILSYNYGDLYINPSDYEQEVFLLGYFKGLSIWTPSTKEKFNNRRNEFETSVFSKIKLSGKNYYSWLIDLFDNKSPGPLL